MWDNSLMYNVHWGEDCEGFNSNLWPSTFRVIAVAFVLYFSDGDGATLMFLFYSDEIFDEGVEKNSGISAIRLK